MCSSSFVFDDATSETHSNSEARIVRIIVGIPPGDDAVFYLRRISSTTSVVSEVCRINGLTVFKFCIMKFGETYMNKRRFLSAAVVRPSA